MTSELELLKRARAGDSEAFCLLARLYERRIYRLALHYCRDPHDAEDLSQEVWLRAFRALPEFRSQSSFYTWLRQITINTFLNHKRDAMRGKSIRVDESEIEDLADLVGVEEQVTNRLLVEKVFQALGELTPKQRLIFLLKHREGMTYEEISASLGCSVGTVKKSLFRAVMKLREKLGAEGRANTNSEPEPCTTVAG